MKCLILPTLLKTVQEQYLRRNCILIHGVTETQDESTDDISLRIINEHL